MEDALLPPEQEVARSNRAGRTNPLKSVQGLPVWPWLPRGASITQDSDVTIP